MKKRFLSLALTLLLILPITALAEEDGLVLAVPANAEDGLILTAPGLILAPLDDVTDGLALAAAYYRTRPSADTWYDVLALASLGILTEDVTMPAENLSSVSGMAAAVLARLAAGADPYADGLAADLKDQQKADGSFGDYLNEHIFSMLALRAAQTPGYNEASAQAYLASQQLADGGFAFFGDIGDIDMTGMALLALEGAPAEAAAAFVMAQATENGGFISVWSETGNENSCSAAAVISGLVAAGFEVPERMLANLLSFQLEDGSFCNELGGETDFFATQQCAIALGDAAAGDSVFTRLPVPSDVPVFTDANNIARWAVSAAKTVYENGLMQGDESGRFMPDGYVTRAELAKILVETGLEGPGGAEMEFSDVEADAWYAPYVSQAVRKGLMTGSAGGVFEPLRQLTREEIAHWLTLALELEESGEPHAASDAAVISEEYRADVNAVMREGLMIGVGGNVFQPKNKLTRQELAVILARMYA